MTNLTPPSPTQSLPTESQIVGYHYTALFRIVTKMMQDRQVKGKEMDPAVDSIVRKLYDLAMEHCTMLGIPTSLEAMKKAATDL